MPEDATLAQMLRRLQEKHETDEALCRFDESGGQFDEDLTDEEWMAMIARNWIGETPDPREDIYTDEDGDPVEHSMDSEIT